MLRVRFARNQARRLIREQGITSPPVDLNQVAKSLGVSIREVPLGHEVSGMVYRDQDTSVIGVNALHSPTRRRFTVAHELGHLVLHKDSALFVDKKFPIFFRDQESGTGENLAEIEANQFAAELLMPLSLLKQELLSIEDIAEEKESLIENLADKFEVSPQALTFRLMNLNLI